MSLLASTINSQSRSAFQALKKKHGTNEFLQVNEDSFGGNYTFIPNERIIDPNGSNAPTLGGQMQFSLPANVIISKMRLQQNFSTAWGGTGNTLAPLGIIENYEIIHGNSTVVARYDKEGLWISTYATKSSIERNKLDEIGYASSTLWSSSQIVQTELPSISNMTLKELGDLSNSLFFTHDDGWSVRITVVVSLDNLGTSTDGTVALPATARLSIQTIGTDNENADYIKKSCLMSIKPIFSPVQASKSITVSSGTTEKSVKVDLKSLKDRNVSGLVFGIYDIGNSTCRYDTIVGGYSGEIAVRDGTGQLLRYENIDVIKSTETEIFSYSFSDSNLHAIPFGISNFMDINDSNSINFDGFSDLNLYLNEVTGLTTTNYKLFVFAVCKNAMKIDESGNISISN